MDNRNTNSLEEYKYSSVAEILDPRDHLPEIAFQSYEQLRNDAMGQKGAFLAGEFRNPELSYPDLDIDRLNNQISRLHEAIHTVDEIEPDKEKVRVISDTIEFRIAEMEYVKLVGELDNAVKFGSPEEQIRTYVDKVRALSEHLYGSVEEDIKNSVRAEVWRQLDNKSLSPSAQVLYNALKNGFKWGDRSVEALPQPDTADSLPDFSHPSLAWAGEIVLADNADIESYFSAFWDQKVGQYGKDWVAQPDDIVEAFEGALRLFDPENISSVQAEIQEGVSAMSWSSSGVAIRVGQIRSPIHSAEGLLQKFIHEGVVHGKRAIEGLKTELPILGTGLFTNTPRGDYLTFEEGLATTLEEAVSGTVPEWNGKNLGHYLNVAQAAEGADFRNVFEIAWRYRLLMSLDDNQEVGEALITKEKSEAYSAVVRIYKGTPLRLQEKYRDIVLPTYNKDLSYLRGRFIVMRYLEELYEANDEDGFRKLFKAKFDPTIPEQMAIVDKYAA